VFLDCEVAVMFPGNEIESDKEACRSEETPASGDMDGCSLYSELDVIRSETPLRLLWSPLPCIQGSLSHPQA